MKPATPPNFLTLLDILEKAPEGLSAEDILEQFAQNSKPISRPTLNRLFTQGLAEGKIAASGLTTGRTYRKTDPLLVLPEAPEVDGNADIVSAFASRVWATADILRGVGVKQSEWPQHMMPFFALMILESRVRRLRQAAMDRFFEGGKTFDSKNENHVSTLRDYFTAYSPGRVVNATKHDGLLIDDEGLAKIASGGSSNIRGRLDSYLSAYDDQTQRLLGHGQQQEKYLGIDETIKMLSGKGAEQLTLWVHQWSLVDLKNYESHDITTLEEHIKRKWADISADTAGKHYTPHDLFLLVADLATDHFRRHPPKDTSLTVYDPTCGGGNMLYGVADRLKAQHPNMIIRERGQEFNASLFALAAVEARFRHDADIRYGDTLKDDQFTGEEFDLIVANPPYGVDWKSIHPIITKDETGRFPSNCLPPVSDGQHLFLQHIQHHLAEHGLGFSFCSGSTLFSGDAGGGESNARMKYFQTDDNVLGIIQLPKDEFFNTGINTYLWIFHKNKPEGLKNLAFFLDASNFATKMRKSLGSKRNELNEDARKLIVALVAQAEEDAKNLTHDKRDEFGKRKDVLGLVGHTENNSVSIQNQKESPLHLRLLHNDEICFNKIELELTKGNKPFEGELQTEKVDFSVTQNGNTLSMTSEMQLDSGIEALSQFSHDGDLDQKIRELQQDPKQVVSLLKEILLDNSVETKGIFKDMKDKKKKAEDRTLIWRGDTTRELISGKDNMGQAQLSVTCKIKKQKDGEEILETRLTLTKDTEKDTETIPFSSNKKENDQFKKSFLNKWVKEKHKILKEETGCEVNFNRLFPKSSENLSLSDVLKEIELLDAEIQRVGEKA